MKKIGLCFIWILVLPVWVALAILHALAVMITSILESLETFFGDSMDAVELNLKMLLMRKTK